MIKQRFIQYNDNYSIVDTLDDKYGGYFISFNTEKLFKKTLKELNKKFTIEKNDIVRKYCLDLKDTFVCRLCKTKFKKTLKEEYEKFINYCDDCDKKQKEEHDAILKSFIGLKVIAYDGETITFDDGKMLYLGE